ncbi:MAG: hypothetical protein HYY51_05045 [Candidatus Magasanikbacteria bacterium]|nr:hypothetical protein [Candidatus Magasanikbacteria bacterium]
MQSSFDRVLHLAQKTGDKLIIFDRQADSHHVLLPIDEYEELLDLARLDSVDEYQESDSEDLEENIQSSFEPHPHCEEPSFAETASWHSAGSVLDEMQLDSEPIDDLPSFDSLSEDPDIHFFSDAPERNAVTESQNHESGILGSQKTDEPAPTEMSQRPVPPSLNPEQKIYPFEEDALEDDEPIFFEEPIE